MKLGSDVRSVVRQSMKSNWLITEDEVTLADLPM
jgi:hypothetical protein